MKGYALLNMPSHLIFCFCTVLAMTQICTCVPAESTCAFPFSAAEKPREGWVSYRHAVGKKAVINSNQK